MAKCLACKREMYTSEGCAIEKLHIDGEVYQRIKYGEEPYWTGQLEPEQRCHDCGALLKNYHHWECDMECCPACGEQLIGCDCEEVEL